MSDDFENKEATPPSPIRASRRGFLKLAGAAAATAAAATVGCAPSGPNDQRAASAGATSAAPRRVDFHRPTLDALGDVMLPASLGANARRDAVHAFVTWVEGYDPVAEEMHGYGYPDVRYLPPDPAPGWRAQLDGLDALARKMRHQPFVALDEIGRREVTTAALAHTPGDRLPDPLGASHIAVALLSHWASGAAAQDLALGAQVGAGTCRKLAGVEAKPLPLAGVIT